VVTRQSGLRPGFSVGQVGAFEVFLNETLAQDFNVDQEVRANLLELAERAVEYAKNLAAKDTGQMAESIRFVGFQTEGDQLFAVIEVGEDAEYWVFVEYGTGSAGASSKQPPPGLPPEYVHGPSGGVIARPFMRPTITYLKATIGG